MTSVKPEPEVQSELARLGMILATSPRDVIPKLELVKETWSERAAIREHLGGAPRWRAELDALMDTCALLGIRVVVR